MPKIPLRLLAAFLALSAVGGGVYYGSRPTAPSAPAAPSVPTDAPTVAPAVVAPQATAQATSSATADPCACATDLATFCPGITAKLDKVACLRAATGVSADCIASLDYAQSLNDGVIAACQPYWSICSTVAPNPRSGTSEGANTSEPCFDSLRAAVGTTVPKGSACDAALQAHDANQNAVKACGRGGAK